MPRLYLVRGAVGASSPVRLNGYFQRVLSCRTPANARKMSIHSGMLTMAFVVPPLLIGMAALTYEFQLFCAVGSVHVQLGPAASGCCGPVLAAFLFRPSDSVETDRKSVV